MLWGEEQEAPWCAWHKTNLIQRSHILRTGKQWSKNSWKGTQKVPSLLQLVCTTSRLYPTSVWFHNIWSGLWSRSRASILRWTRFEHFRYLHMKYINKYNNEMGIIDTVYQIIKYYKIDLWVRNIKWWWSIFVWDVGLILTSSYIIYI